MSVIFFLHHRMISTEYQSSLFCNSMFSSFYSARNADFVGKIDPISAPNKYGHHLYLRDGLNQFGKLTNNNSHFPVPSSITESTKRFQQYHDLFDHQRYPAHDHSSDPNSLLLNGGDRDRFRFKPYEKTPSKDRQKRYNKILYKSTHGIENLDPKPGKFASFTLKDKLAQLKHLITGFDSTNKAKDDATQNDNYCFLKSHGLSSLLMEGFNPAETSTPFHLDKNFPKTTRDGISTSGQKLHIEQKPPQSAPSTTQTTIELTETPSLPKTLKATQTSDVSIDAVSSTSTSFLNKTVRQPISAQQQWRAKKFHDERENRQKVAEELEKEIQLREKSRHNRGQTEEENRQLRLRLEGLVLERRVPPKEEFPELPLEAKQLVKIIWNKRQPHDEIFANGFGADITRKDLLTLSGLDWLNDEVINFFLNLIVERNQLDPNLPKTYTFNTFFYQKLESSGYAGVKRWTRKVDIFANELLIVPIHLPNHWCMAIIDLKERKMDYYDSMCGTNEHCLQLLSDYLCEESQDKRKQPFDFIGWERKCRKDIPCQTNFSDCGMFSCLFAEYASRRAPITFGQKQIPYFRERMVYEIRNKKLL